VGTARWRLPATDSGWAGAAADHCFVTFQAASSSAPPYLEESPAVRVTRTKSSPDNFHRVGRLIFPYTPSRRAEMLISY
jgi:hypothetical protein